MLGLSKRRLTAACVLSCALLAAPIVRAGATTGSDSRQRAAEQAMRDGNAQMGHAPLQTQASASALPTSASVNDPTGDDLDAFDPHGDITHATMSDDGHTLRLTVSTLEFDDPSTSDNWFDNLTYVGWYLDTTGDGVADDFAIMFNDQPDVIGLIGGITAPDPSCEDTPTWSAANNSYTMAFPVSCIGSPKSVLGVAEADYETATDDSLDDTDLVGPIAPPAVAVQGLHGYWMVGATGTVYSFGSVANFGSTNTPFVTHLEPTPTGKGYWIVDAVGHVFAFGDAANKGGAPALQSGEIVTSLSSTPTGKGYWMFTSRGRVFTFGDATFHGDMSGVALNGPVLGSIATPTGKGYYMVASDGGVFSFGDAGFRGSMGGTPLNKPVEGLVPTADNRGYWLVASDGGIFAFGDAPFRGSMGSTALNRPVVGMVRFGNGYLMVASDGGIFDFSSTPFFGSLGSNPPATPIVGVGSFG